MKSGPGLYVELRFYSALKLQSKIFYRKIKALVTHFLEKPSLIVIYYFHNFHK
jgi:hypothetical protein